MKSRLDVMKALDANIPTEVVQQRQGSGGKMLDYLPGWYVKQKLTEVFGPFWAFKVKSLDAHDSGKTTRNGAPIINCDCIGELTVYFKDGDVAHTIVREDYGFGNGDTELANKEAVTDALKRCAATLGNSLGLGLYDPTKARVGEPTLSKKDGDVLYKATEGSLRLAKSTAEVLEFWKDNAEAINTLPRDYIPHLIECRDALLVKFIAEQIGCADSMADLGAVWKSEAKALKTISADFLGDVTKLKDQKKEALA